MQESSTEPSLKNRRSSRKSWLRNTLTRSQQEAVASSTMTATSDNFFNAFAIFLQASLGQMAWVTGLPQLFGACFQLLSIWLAHNISRRKFIVFIALIQTIIVLAMAVLAVKRPEHAVWIFILLAALYHGCVNLIQPHWRAWMGSIVPERRRGAFFASRTRLTMISSLLIFLIGGALLNTTDGLELSWLGFTLLFLIAIFGRIMSARLLWLMHDPDVNPKVEGKVFANTLINFKAAWKDKTFRQYSLFVGGMNAMVAISAPYFAVYMLQYIHFSYLEYVLAVGASIATQFLMLKFWGKFSDTYGNRIVMIITSCLIPTLPLLWLFSSNFIYILIIQALSGFAWSGFTLSTSNYLYDIRPFKSDFSTYAALQSALSAALVFVGAIFGGIIAANAESFIDWSTTNAWLTNPIFLVFLVSTLLRGAVTLWFIPRSIEPKIRPRPKLLSIVLRVARFNAISGVAFDWLTVIKKDKRVDVSTLEENPYKKTD